MEASTGAPNEPEQQSSFGIKKIVDCKIGEGGRQMYKVKWEPTWEPAENLASCQHLIDEFWSFVNKAKTNEEVAQQHRKRMRLEPGVNNMMNMDPSTIDRLSEDNKADVQRLIARANATSVGNPMLMSPSNMLMSPQRNQQNNMMGMARTPTHANNQNFPNSPQTPQMMRQQNPGMQMMSPGQKSLNFGSPQQNMGGQGGQQNFNSPGQKGKMAGFGNKPPTPQPKSEPDDMVDSSKSTPFILDGWKNEFAEVAFLCKICKKNLPSDRKGSWKAHFKTHSDSKEYTCEICKKGFHTRFNMERHVKVHFKNTPNTSMQNTSMPNTSLQNTNMQNTSLQNTSMQNTNMQNTNMQNTNIQNTMQLQHVPDIKEEPLLLSDTNNIFFPDTFPDTFL